MAELNFSKKSTSIKNSISFWKRRKLTLSGRITVVKSLLIPVLSHLFIKFTRANQRMDKTTHYYTV